VPNPSFEQYDYCPNGTADPSAVSFWYNPTNGSPDYYNECAGSNGAGIPINDWGYQEANDGQAYIGLATIAFDSGLNEYREYFEVELTETLQAGSSYYWCMHVSRLDSAAYGSNNIGVGIVEGSSTNFTSNSILALSNFDFFPDIITEESNWLSISGIVTAKGGEDHLIIGNFQNDGSTDVSLIQSNAIGGEAAYYYVDDVYFGTQPCSPTFMQVPNVFTPNGDGINDVFTVLTSNIELFDVKVVDRWGTLVYSSSVEVQWDGDFQGLNCNEGTYFYVVTGLDKFSGQFIQKTGFIQLVR